MSKIRFLNQINEIIIHCADTPNGVFYSAEDIDAWHKHRHFIRDKKLAHYSNLKHIGYHYVIYLDGSIVVGRRNDETGAHAKGHNSNSLGICLIGRDKFTQYQWDSLKALVATLQQRYPRIDAFNIIGHHSVNSHKTCPNFDVTDWLDNHRNALANHLLEEKL